MSALLMISSLLAAGGPIRFERHDIDSFRAGYQVAVADVNGDGKPDVIAASTEADRVDWYENPGWKRRVVARTPRNIDLAVYDVDRDGRPEIALASGFYFSESTRGGEIQLLFQPARPGDPWRTVSVGVDPVVHRVRWGDLDGDGTPELVHGPLFGPGSRGPADPKGAHLWAFRIPSTLEKAAWEVWKIDQSLTVLHGLHVGDLDGDGRDEILTASFEGIHRFDFEGAGPAGRWQKSRLSPGASPKDDRPGTPRGSSEVAPGRAVSEPPLLAAIEPWHGNLLVVYTPADKRRRWQRRVIDDTLNEGHALVVADFDRDGTEEIVAGWRGESGGLALYQSETPQAARFAKINLDRGINVEGAVAADLDLDGKLDLVVIAGRSNNLAWYKNLTP